MRVSGFQFGVWGLDPPEGPMGVDVRERMIHFGVCELKEPPTIRQVHGDLSCLFGFRVTVDG